MGVTIFLVAARDPEIDEITTTELARRCDFRELAEARLHPFGDRWEREGDVDYLVHWYRRMKELIEHAADLGSGFLVCVA